VIASVFITARGNPPLPRRQSCGAVAWLFTPFSHTALLNGAERHVESK